MSVKLKGAKLTLVLLLFVATIGVATGFATNPVLLQVSDGDGFVSDDRENVRVVDFELASNTIAEGVDLQTETVIANYGYEEQDITVGPEIYDLQDGSIQGVTSSSDYSINPDEEFDINLEPGETVVLNHLIRFDETGDYEIRMIDKDASSPDSLNISSQTVTVEDEGTTSTGTELIDKSPASIDALIIDTYKDSRTADLDIPNSEIGIPPVERDNSGNIDAIDVAIGDIDMFGNIISGEDSASEIRSDGQNILVGMSTDGVPSDDHYGVELRYESIDTNGDIELKLVNSVGEEIDEETEYLMYETDGVEQYNIHFSSEEVEYISQQNEYYMVLDGEDVGSGGLDIYQMDLLAANEVFNLPEGDINIADMNIETSTSDVMVGDRIQVSIEVTNEGNAAVTDRFRIFEDIATSSDSALQISSPEVINPGDTVEITQSLTLSQSGEHEFRVLDETRTLDVEDEDSDVIRGTVFTSDDFIIANDNVDFTLLNIEDEEMNRIEEVRWYIDDPSTPSEVISDPQSTDELDITTQFNERRTYDVTAEIDFERESGESDQTSSSIEVEVVDGPQLAVSEFTYEISEVGQDTFNSPIGSSFNIDITSESCSLGCDGNMEVLSSELPQSDGINMLVVETEPERNQYEVVHYGAYNIQDSTGTFGRTSDITEQALSGVDDNLDSNSGDPVQALLSDINTHSEESNRYTVLTSGGDLDVASQTSNLENQLDEMGANLDGDTNLDSDAAWTFATQSVDGNYVPLHESYKSGSSTISENLEIVPTDVDGTPPIDRPVYYDLSQSNAQGGVENADITWDFPSETIEDEVSVTQVFDEKQSVYEVTMVDDMNIEATEERDLMAGTISPIAEVSDISFEVDSLQQLDGTESYDRDSSIESYEWTIDENGDTTQLTGPSPSYEWTEVGLHPVELKVTDIYGNTESIEKEISVSEAAPEIDYNINRITSDLMSDSSFYAVEQTPALHYPFDNAHGTTVPDESNGLTGEISELGDFESGVSNQALDVSDSELVTPQSQKLSSDELTVSMWVNPDNIQNEQTIVEKLGEYELYIDSEGLGFDVWNFNTEIRNLDELESGEWNHIAVTVDSDDSLGINKYVNGDRVDVQQSPSANNNNEEIVIGSGLDGDIDDFRLYDEELRPSEVRAIYENDASYESTNGIQSALYTLGESYTDITTHGADIEDYRITMESDARVSDSDSEFVVMEDIDMSDYDSLYVAYEMRADRGVFEGAVDTGYISAHTLGDQTEYGQDGSREIDGKSAETVSNIMEDHRTGLLELDVSGVSEEDVTIHTYAEGDVNGYVETSVYDVWLATSDVDKQSIEEKLSNALYPRNTPLSVDVLDVREGMLFTSMYNSDTGISLSSPAGGDDVRLTYDIDENGLSSTSGSHIFTDESGYDVSTILSASDTIYCNSSTSLQESCSGEDAESGTEYVEGNIDGIGLEMALSENSAVTLSEFKTEVIENDSSYPTVVLNASETEAFGGDNDIQEYQWDHDPGTTFEADDGGPETRVEYTTTGEKEVALRVIDEFGQSAEERITFDVDNLEPNINLVSPTQLGLNEEGLFSIQFDGNGDDIEELYWFMGDGSVQTTSPDEDTFRHTYGLDGAHDVMVIAVDESGLTAADKSTVEVRSEPPVIENLNGELSTHVRDTIIFDASGEPESDIPERVTTVYDASDAEDPDGDDLTYIWDLPDGSQATGETVEYETFELTGNEDSKQATLTVINEQGQRAVKDIDVTTFNDGPNLDIRVNGPADPLTEATDATYVKEDAQVSIEASHPHPRIEGDIDMTTGDGTEYNYNLPASTTPEDISQDHRFDVPPEQYQEEDFPVEFQVQADIVDDYGATDMDTYDMEVQYRGVEIQDFYSINDFGERTAELELGAETDFNADIHAPDTDWSDLEMRYTFFDGEDSGNINSDSYTHQFTDTGTAGETEWADVEVTDTAYGGFDEERHEFTLEIRESCLRIQQNAEDSPGIDPESGLYHVVPVGFDEAVEVYCDMEYDGGGWTLVLSAKARDDGNGYNDGPANDAWETPDEYSTPNANFGELEQDSIGDAWKLSDEMITQMQVDGQGIIRATTLDLEYSNNQKNGEPVRRFFDVGDSTYQHDTNVVNRGDDLTTSYASPDFNNQVQTQDPPSGWRLQGIADGHYDPKGTGYATVHCHNPCFVDAPTAIWVR